METISDRHAKLVKDGVVNAAASLAFAEQEVFANLIDVRAGRPVAKQFIPEGQEGDFELGLEMYRCIHSIQSNVNPTLAMGAIARRAGLQTFREEPTKFALQKQEWAKALRGVLEPLLAMWAAMCVEGGAVAGAPPVPILQAQELLLALEKDPNV